MIERANNVDRTCKQCKDRTCKECIVESHVPAALMRCHVIKQVDTWCGTDGCGAYRPGPAGPLSRFVGPAAPAWRAPRIGRAAAPRTVRPAKRIRSESSARQHPRKPVTKPRRRGPAPAAPAARVGRAAVPHRLCDPGGPTAGPLASAEGVPIRRSLPGIFLRSVKRT